MLQRHSNSKNHNILCELTVRGAIWEVGEEVAREIGEVGEEGEVPESLFHALSEVCDDVEGGEVEGEGEKQSLRAVVQWAAGAGVSERELGEEEAESQLQS